MLFRKKPSLVTTDPAAVDIFSDIREARVAENFHRAIDKLEKFLQNEELVALFDAHVATHFEFDEELNPERERLFSLPDKLADGMKIGLRTVIRPGQICQIKWEACIAAIDHNYRIISASTEKKIKPSWGEYRCIEYGTGELDREEDKDIEKDTLHEAGHAILAIGLITDKTNLDFKLRAMTRDTKRIAGIFKQINRNEELFCDTLADFAMPEYPAYEWRTKMIYQDELAIREAAVLSAAQCGTPSDKNNARQKVQEWICRKDEVLANEDEIVQMDARNRLQRNGVVESSHPSSARFCQNSHYMMGVLDGYYKKIHHPAP